MAKIYTIKSKQGKEVTLEINIENQKHDIFFRAINDANINLSLSNKALTSILLTPLMKNDAGDLNIAGQLDSKFLTNIDTLQDIYTRWDNDLHRVKIKSTANDEVNHKGKRVGAFFTGGVDSFYTLLKHEDEITDLILIHGYDIDLNDISLRKEVSQKINHVAKEFGKNLIEIESNLRRVLDISGDWGGLAHGPDLTAIGHLLSEHFSKIFIASTHTYGELFPWDSHPLTDPLWSSDSLTFIHDGCEADRVEKVALISKSAIALNYLRVCYVNTDSAYNCCECGKCLRTMVSLKVNNALDKCTTFEKELDYNLVSKMFIPDENTKVRIQENIVALRATGKDKKLEKALNKSMNTFKIYSAIKLLIPQNIKQLIPWNIKTKLRELVNKCLW